jgi:hypothetical protein
MREESVDGTLSPVSMKGGIELLDNDTGTARRKVGNSTTNLTAGYRDILLISQPDTGISG